MGNSIWPFMSDKYKITSESTYDALMESSRVLEYAPVFSSVSDAMFSLGYTPFLLGRINTDGTES